MTQSRAPFDQALKEYTITPDTLWVGFFFDHLELDPNKIVNQGFSLSYPGQQGVEAILRVNGPDTGFLGCFSLSTLEILLVNIDEQISRQSATLSNSVASWLRVKRNFLIIARNESEEFLRCVNTFTIQSAISSIREIHPNHEIVFGGELNDMKALISQMRDVIRYQDFSKIKRDRRDRVLGWKASNLLAAKRSPNTEASFIQLGEALDA